MSEPSAPFIPPTPEEQPIPAAPWKVFGSPEYFRLWAAQVVSSLGDWIGIIAILAIAARVSGGSGAAVSLVMVARMLPGFVLAPLGGALVDRLDRRKVMITCDLGRAALFVALAFVADSIFVLVVFSFIIEVLTLLWGPAKDASTPRLVSQEQLASANSLSLVAAYGMMPIGAVVFASLAGIATWLGGFEPLKALQVDQEALALWVDGATFLVSALLIWKLPLGRGEGERRPIDWTQTYRDIVGGFRFIASHPEVRGVMLGLGCGLIGGGAMVPLGPVFSAKVLGEGAAGFGVLMTALGFGAAIGVVTLLWLQRKLPRMTVFLWSVVGTGAGIIIAATFSSLYPSAFAIAFVGACAGTAYVTGFTVLQEEVADELRGRTFATLYTVVRLCLLFSLTVSPLFADVFGWISGKLVDGQIEIGSVSYALPGVRIALWIGGGLTLGAGFLAARAAHRAHVLAARPDRSHVNEEEEGPVEPPGPESGEATA